MGGENLTMDQREQRLIATDRAIARLRQLQMQDLAELDVAQVAMADGSRSLSEWVSGRLDQGIDSARTLVRTMRRLQDRPDLQDRLTEGSASFDRIEALSRINDDVGLMEWADVAAGAARSGQASQCLGAVRASLRQRPIHGHAAFTR